MSLDYSGKAPFFSVIIPAYNAGQFLELTLQSVYRQSFTNFEIIVINDGSTDNTRNILERQIDSRIKIVHQENSGVSISRNHGIRLAQGKYLAFLDADDIWLPYHLEIAYHFFTKFPDYVWYTARSIRREHIEIEDCQIYNTQPIHYSAINWFLEGHKILECGSNFFVKRTVIVDNFDEFYPANLVMCEDNVAWCKLGILYPMMGVPNLPSVLYRIWGDSAIHRHGLNNASRYIQEHQKLYAISSHNHAIKLFIKHYSYANWLMRISCMNMYSWRKEIKKRAKVTGFFLTVWLLIFAWINNIFCRLMKISIAICFYSVNHRMQVEALKTRKHLNINE